MHFLQLPLLNQTVLIGMALFVSVMLYRFLPNKKILACFTPHFKHMRWEKHGIYHRVDGFYKGRYIECFSGMGLTPLQGITFSHLYIRTNVIEELKGKNIPLLSRGIDAQFGINFVNFSLIYNIDFITQFKHVFTHSIVMTPEKAKDILEQMLVHCEKTSRGEYTI